MLVTEAKLYWRCLFSSVLFVVSIITLGVVWGHWAYTLDVDGCPNPNCGCILFGRAFSDTFAGGNVIYCQVVVYAQAPVFIAVACLTIYHGYRAFIKPKKQALKTAQQRNPLLYARKGANEKLLDSEPADPEPEPPSYKMAVALCVISILTICTLLTIVVLTLYGFYTSCNAYRKTLVTTLGASGNVADIINSRMQCNSVFDFLDYLQPDRVAFDKPRSMQYMRKDRINTGITLLIAKSALFMNFINWIFITAFNFKRLTATGKAWCCKASSPSLTAG